MCDTFIIPPRFTASGCFLFAKNSDREPNEAQHLVYVPRTVRNRERVQTSFIEVPHPKDTYAVILSKPFQLWGAEMGINEHKVVIGNEAVFTKIPLPGKNTGLTGMDMIRLALESCKTAKEALDQICFHTETYGQDACGGYYDKKFYYHNTYIIADPSEAFVLETAGEHWVYRKLTGFYAISNRLTIGETWDGISLNAIPYAKRKGWTGKHAAFSFADAYTAPLMSRLSMGANRRRYCETQAMTLAAKKKLTPGDAFSILRSHPRDQSFSPHRGKMNNICLHASGLLTPSQTTGSLVAELKPGLDTPVWGTGTAAPCLSLFKPFYFGNTVLEESIFLPPGPRADRSYWWQWESWHRMALKNYGKAKLIWQEKAHPQEQNWLQQAMTTTDLYNRAQFSQSCLDSSSSILNEMKKALEPDAKFYPGIWYRTYWHRLDAKAGY